MLEQVSSSAQSRTSGRRTEKPQVPDTWETAVKSEKSELQREPPSLKHSLSERCCFKSLITCLILHSSGLTTHGSLVLSHKLNYNSNVGKILTFDPKWTLQIQTLQQAVPFTPVRAFVKCDWSIECSVAPFVNKATNFFFVIKRIEKISKVCWTDKHDNKLSKELGEDSFWIRHHSWKYQG